MTDDVVPVKGGCLRNRTRKPDPFGNKGGVRVNIKQRGWREGGWGREVSVRFWSPNGTSVGSVLSRICSCVSVKS